MALTALTPDITTLTALPWSVDWYSLRADSLKTSRATPLVLLRFIPHHHYLATSYKRNVILLHPVVNICRTVVWCHLHMRCIALRHMYMRGHEGNTSTVLLHGACTRMTLAVCRPAMPWGNPSQYLIYGLVKVQDSRILLPTFHMNCFKKSAWQRHIHANCY
jgi:hypothetical protein